MTIFVDPDTDNLILKYLIITDYINISLANKNNNSLIIQKKYYIKYKKYHNSYKNTKFSEKFVYLNYFYNSCKSGLKFIIKYLINKYEFRAKIDILFYGFQNICYSNNIETIKWYFNYYNMANIFDFINILRNFTTDIAIEKWNTETFEFIISKSNPNTYKQYLPKLQKYSWKSKNLDLIKYILDNPKIPDGHIILDKFSNNCTDYIKSMKSLKFILDNYYFDPQILRYKRDALWSSLNYDYEYQDKINLLNLLDKKLNLTPDYSLNYKLLININNIIFGLADNSENNIDYISNLILELSGQIYLPAGKYIEYIWPKILKIGNLKLIKLFCSEFKNIIISRRFPFSYYIPSRDILDYLVSNFEIKFIELFEMCTFKTTNYLDYLIKYLEKNNIPVNNFDIDYIIRNGSPGPGSSPELINLILNKNPYLFPEIRRWLHFCKIKLLKYLYEKKYISDADIFNSYWIFRFTGQFCDIIDYSTEPNFIPELIKKTGHNFSEDNLQVLFGNSLRVSWDLAILIYAKLQNKPELDNITNRWLNIPIE